MKSATILVVDDEPGMRDVLKDDLEMEGYRVLTAESGNKALMVLENELVHLIISDVRMPDGDGVFLVQEVRKRYPGLPLVALMTGFSDVSKDQAEKYGAKAMLPKPYDYDKLCAVVEDLLSVI